MPKKSKWFECGDCLVVFEINVEPGKTTEEVEANCPDSLDWVEHINTCPVCARCHITEVD